MEGKLEEMVGFRNLNPTIIDKYLSLKVNACGKEYYALDYDSRLYGKMDLTYSGVIETPFTFIKYIFRPSAVRKKNRCFLDEKEKLDEQYFHGATNLSPLDIRLTEDKIVVEAEKRALDTFMRNKKASDKWFYELFHYIPNFNVNQDTEVVCELGDKILVLFTDGEWKDIDVTEASMKKLSGKDIAGIIKLHIG